MFKAMVQRCDRPTQWLVPLVTIQVALQGLPEDLQGLASVQHLASVLIILSISWLIVGAVRTVTETSERAMQVRVLVSAVDSGKAFDLRCELREGLIGYIQREFPGALPRLRGGVEQAVPVSPAP